MNSKRSQEGYLMVDHRNSPGITEADLLSIPIERRAEFAPRKGMFESPTIRCCHCGTMVILNPNRTRPRGYCGKCDHYTCDSPYCVPCNPFNKQVDDALTQATLIITAK
jgi:ribosomal protein S27AE